MKEQKKKHLFTNRQLAALLIPLALDQLLNSFMGTVDTLIVSNIGSAAISAVSLVDAINILVVEAFLPWRLEVRSSVLSILETKTWRRQIKLRVSLCLSLFFCLF